MTKNELSYIRRALKDIDAYELAWLEAFPEARMSEPQRFDERVLNRAADKSKRYPIKRIVTVLIAAALALATAISAYAFREPIRDFFMKQRDTYNMYEHPSENPTPVTEGIYQPKWLPNGYIQSNYSESKASVQTTWENGTDIIILKQKLLAGGGSIDTENSNYEVLTVNGQNYHCISKNGVHDIIWRNELYAFTIWYYGGTREDALKIATSLEIEKEFPKG